MSKFAKPYIWEVRLQYLGGDLKRRRFWDLLY
jgi:hypothetical protein